MSATKIDQAAPPYDTAITLAAGVAQKLVFDCGNGTTFGVYMKNTGPNAITALALEMSLVADVDAEYQANTAAQTALGTPASGASAKWSVADKAERFVRLTLTSTSGTTVQLSARAL